MRKDGGQLLSYFCQDKNAQFLCLYTSDYSSDVDKKLTYRNIIISTKDNEDFLREKNLKGYNNAKTVPEIFQVWRDVYEFAAEEKGIFEKEFNAYNAGKAALNFNDLKEITQKDTSGKSGEDGKYHEFAKILRKYNISGKEINLLISFCAKFMTKRITKIISIFVIAALWRIALKAYKIAS